jgi:hypothetical protein
VNPIMKTTLCLVTLVFTSFACATLRLTPQGAAVQIVTMTPADLASGYGALAVVSCSRGYNARSTRTNIVQCQNELRNKAAAIGGEVLMITSQQLGTADCENCVTLVATTYRRKAS